MRNQARHQPLAWKVGRESNRMEFDMRLKTLALAAGALMLSAGAASAAVVTNDLNLRSGPGTNYQVVDTMPAGARVNVLSCTGGWCRAP